MSNKYNNSTLRQDPPSLVHPSRNGLEMPKRGNRYVNSFITNLQDNKEAFTLFKDEAAKRGMYKPTPLP